MNGLLGFLIFLGVVVVLICIANRASEYHIYLGTVWPPKEQRVLLAEFQKLDKEISNLRSVGLVAYLHGTKEEENKIHAIVKRKETRKYEIWDAMKAWKAEHENPKHQKAIDGVLAKYSKNGESE